MTTDRRVAPLNPTFLPSGVRYCMLIALAILENLICFDSISEELGRMRMFTELIHFVLEENMLEVDCPCVTPEVVLKASGHVEKFTDLMLQKDLTISAGKAAELKHVLPTLDDLSPEALGAKIKEYGITAPDTKNPLSDPYPFNLMFQTSIGPSGLSPGYMRPETAQGIFVNFKDLYYYNGNKLPFAAAQIGQHFVNPDDKSHPKYTEVADLEFLMFLREEQMSGQSAKKIRLGDAVSKGIVNNETLCYFIGRVYLFLSRLGIDKDRLRSAYDLRAHSVISSLSAWLCLGVPNEQSVPRGTTGASFHCLCQEKSSVPLVAAEKFAEPREVEKLFIAPVKKELGLAFKGSQKNVVEALEEKKKEHQRVFTPSVIEPSFGIGRIIYCLFEHSFYTRPSKAGDEQLNVFRFPPLVSLTAAGISHKIDITGTSIGKRYARTDELGVPFAITVDSTTDVTIRERDRKLQVRVRVEEAASVVKSVTDGHRTWEDVWEKFPHHTSGSAED
ncbi:Glycine--tRNA ligase 1 [Hibiscus syriacus]|uniref:Glycine--tRNA ligase 1 n=1 Tax=Hibiscus syriacus TaxID=106335 RepID=A0A6A2ZMH3_HIBSY|nr:Glycine--tRNA ligase 1 [Hibiscus syriacus]